MLQRQYAMKGDRRGKCAVRAKWSTTIYRVDRGTINILSVTFHAEETPLRQYDNSKKQFKCFAATSATAIAAATIDDSFESVDAGPGVESCSCCWVTNNTDSHTWLLSIGVKSSRILQPTFEWLYGYEYITPMTIGVSLKNAPRVDVLCQCSLSVSGNCYGHAA